MNEFFTVLKELYDDQELFNTTVLTEDGGSFRVHWEMLFAMSPYLKRIIIAAKDKHQMEDILIPGISKDIMANIINFMYTGTLRLTMDKVTTLVKACEFLEMLEAIGLCKEFLKSKMNDENCITIYNFAKYFQYGDLKEEATSYIIKHFHQIFPVSNDYLNLQVDDLVAMLSNDALNVRIEEEVFWAVIRWVENEPDTRTIHLPSLLRCVRFGLCDLQFYERSIASHPYVVKNEECQAVILQMTQLLQDMPVNDLVRGHPLPDVRHPFFRPRIPRNFIFMMGGWSGGSATSIIETYDIRCGQWFLSSFTDNIPRAYHGMLWHKGYIYVIGGFDGNQCFNTVRRFDPVSHVWEEKSCMLKERCYVSVAAVGDYLYAMGGYDGRQRSNTCERYAPDSNQWTMVASMNQVRSDASADSLNSKIYIAGGFNGEQVLSSAECYDPELDLWMPITLMNSPRSGLKLAAYCEHLYAIGGYNGNIRLATVEKYDPLTRNWCWVPPMRCARSNFAVAVLDECLYAIGGFDGLYTISRAECFDHRKNLWLQVTDLNLNRSALAACTVTDISNVHEYTYQMRKLSCNAVAYP